jgi:hypothetical protein
MNTRREFLAFSAATGVLLKLDPELVFAAVDGADDMLGLSLNRLESLRLYPRVAASKTKERSTELLESHFFIMQSDQRVLEVELIEVNEGLQTEDTDCFSLIFHTMNGPALETNTYRVYHNQLGEFPLYLEHIERNEYGYYYKAMVNRLVGRREKRKLKRSRVAN